MTLYFEHADSRNLGGKVARFYLEAESVEAYTYDRMFNCAHRSRVEKDHGAQFASLPFL